MDIRREILLADTAERELPNTPEILSQPRPKVIEHFSQESSLQFSEGDDPWRAIPRWVLFLLHCGYVLTDSNRGSRRIGLISLPCESPGAGVVALGAICQRLGKEEANDSTLHYQRIEQLASNHPFTFLRHSNRTGRFSLQGKDEKGVIWVGSEGGGLRGTRLAARFAIFPWSACEWHFDGEAPVKSVKGTQLPHGVFYEALMNGWPIVRSNLSFSDSGVCFAGRVAGESVSKDAFLEIRFKQNNRVADLSELLTIQNWSPGMISRLTFFNTRTHQLDRNSTLTRLVVADGDAAFLRVLEATEFKASDVLGVVSRTVERERLESISFKIAELQQWYVPDLETASSMRDAPSGITTLMLKRR